MVQLLAASSAASNFLLSNSCKDVASNLTRHTGKALSMCQPYVITHQVVLILHLSGCNNKQTENSLSTCNPVSVSTSA